MDEKIFKEFMASCKEHVSIAKGEKKAARRTSVPSQANVKAIRGNLKLTQEQFALMMGVSVWTLRNWEQGRREPDGPAKTLLQVAEKEPEALIRATRLVTKAG
ncbi:MAG: helix-turn-helix domain-containing protein [Planctomycetes bacterium]|nr:helix-turn-helix domain-containing protein [Planctomycetota bacterium]